MACVVQLGQRLPAILSSSGTVSSSGRRSAHCQIPFPSLYAVAIGFILCGIPFTNVDEVLDSSIDVPASPSARFSAVRRPPDAWANPAAVSMLYCKSLLLPGLIDGAVLPRFSCR